ncbi:chromosome-associated kinesin KIF4 like protein [Danaus plexippus plexippus]|uniref:Chromosome-associated kinesin KIF4 like protein n=1 Tax=Danaus plexippus plexippus TaxID=278856 RepID=A0A212EJ78_DANPL|nr:chromosome-associated kinesin KIF4 like protein [Danaus plexippus plexippus]
MRTEIERGCDECIDVVSGEQQVQIKDLAFTYNYVFPQHINQQEFYDTAVKGLIGKLFQGYNVTILAYGQTGSGKTYTMGTNYSGSDGDSTKLGVIPQAVADIFDFIETHEDKFIFKVSVSFMELYQEQCYDLLSGKERGHSIIEIREDINKGVILPGITELPVASTRETMTVLERGSSGRVTGSTAMNQASSRSHAVFTIVIAKESRSDKNLATTSKFHLVDLAGSERIKKTKASGERLREGVKINQGLLALGNVISALGDGTNRSFISYRDSKLTRLNLATTSKFHLVDLAGSERIKKTKASGERLREGVKINQGLLALGNVISALGDGTNRSFISYRDSKLTRLLQDSLGGNSLTLMVACVSPADYNLDETVSTLRYADRARRIRNKPVINQDAKAAEIVRLNNLVNELRLQLLGKLPTISEQNNEQLQEELDRERAKYSELLKKHKQVTEHLNNMLIENTNLCEKALLAEAAKDKIERKLNEMTEHCNQTIEHLNVTDTSQDDAQKSTVVDYLKEIKMRLEDLQSVNLKTNEELIDHEIKLSFVKEDVDGEKADDDVMLNEDQAVLEEEKRAMGQVALNQELQELNRAMAIKASVVQAILANNKEILDSHNNLKENEERISQLEKQRDELMQQLKQSKSKDPSMEERRTKVSTLEQEISDLKRKCQQQANIIKTKEKNEAKIAALNAELQAMKATKVKIIRQMREESEKFRKWKADNERAMLRLRNEDRKRATAMAKMESLHAKQQNVLKRKMEEAVAVNRRLKEALDRQKHTAMKRNAKGSVKAGALQQYIEQELEVHLSIVEAERSLEELMEYRAWITEQIENLRNSADDEANRKKITELEDDLALRKAQISDLQQKILTADQENKSRTQWDNIQSMLEAKVALKCLFELLVDAKRELQNQSEKGYQARYEEIKETYDRLAVEFETTKTEFERQLASVKLQNEQKLSALVALQRGVVGRGERSEACRHLQNVIQYQQDRLEQLEQENKKLADELEELRTASKKAKKRSKKDSSMEATKKVEYVEPTDEEDDEVEDPDKDPDWRATPLFKRIQAQRSRLTMNFTMDENRAIKRSNDGATHCTCRGSCSTKMCGCVKSERGCGTGCRCQAELCKNRRVSSDSEDKENNPSSTEYSLDTTPPSSYFDKRFESSDELNQTNCDEKPAPSPQQIARLRPQSERRLITSGRTQKWLLALLIYNTCVAPVSEYCAKSLIQYGLDVAKDNVLSSIMKYMTREVILIDHLDATYKKKKKSYFFPQDATNGEVKKKITEGVKTEQGMMSFVTNQERREGLLSLLGEITDRSQ